MFIAIIAPFLNLNQEKKNRYENYAARLEEEGNSVHLACRDTNMKASSIEICMRNSKRIQQAEEVHIFYESDRVEVHFDIGIAFAHNKKIVVVDSCRRSDGPSFQNLLAEWNDI